MALKKPWLIRAFSSRNARIAKKAPMSKRDAAPFETPEPCGRGTRQGKY